MSEVVKGILRAISSGLQIPTIIILILLILLTILMLGSFFAELFTERRSLKLNIPKLVDQLQGKSTAEMKEVVASSSLLTRQKAAAQELISRVSYPDDTREALARQLIADEESRYNKIVKITDLTARVAPMFGLMGTLIPLGPGLIALGQGDTKTLSDSLLIAFDTTVAGLISGAISYVVSGFRKGWYEEYMIGLETIMETILDVQNGERRRAMEQKKAADAARAGQTGAQAAGQPGAAQPASRDTVTLTRSQMAGAAGQAGAQTGARAGQAAGVPGAQAAARPAGVPGAAGTARPTQTAGIPGAQAGAAGAAGMAAQAGAPTRPQQPADLLAQTPQGRAAAAGMSAAQGAGVQTPQAGAAGMQRPQQPAQTGSILSKPSFAQANSQTIAGFDAEQLQAEVRAAEAAMRRSEEAAAQTAAAAAKEQEQIQSLDELLESFAPKDGRL